MNKYVCTLFFLTLTTLNIFSQSFTQTVRGRVIDKESQSPIPGVNIVVLNTDPLIGTATDADGYFVLENIAARRVSVQATFIGYETAAASNVELTTGKELVLNFEMEEKVNEMQAVVISADDEKAEAQNDMASVSARQFTIEESQRYAGARNDVSRMAQNFAGVRGSNDAVNDIVIRGNSPVGLLWRMEGVDIPNPNHFGDFGSSGGPVSMLNNNVLANSDFLTGAFPAEYGNAISGAFDLRMRTGNIEQYEFLGQLGLNGLEFGAEGPINKSKHSSFLINYRYSTLGVMSALGINFGTGSAIPYYQDLTFKLNLPVNAKNIVTVFGLGGLSSIDILTSEDTTNDNLYTDYVDVYNRVQTGVAGISHTFLLNSNAYTKLIIAATGMTQKNIVDSVSFESFEAFDFYRERFSINKLQAVFFYKKKFNAQHNLEAGIRVSDMFTDMQDSISNNAGESYVTLTSFEGTTWLLQPYIEYQYKLNNEITFNSGIQSQYLSLNHHYTIEPRLGIKYELSDKDILSFGYGLHSMMPSAVYYYNTQLNASGNEYTPNTNLDFVKAHHFVIGYDHLFSETLRIKGELYYQSLFDVVIDKKISSFASLNAGTFTFGIPDSLQNGGTGENYGAEITIEKFLDKGFYFLATGSFYDSKYTGSDGIERKTAFAGNYVVNTLAGKEFSLYGKKELPKYQKFIVLDGKLTAAGGQRYTPILLDESIAAGEAVYDNAHAFSQQFKDYLRVDVRAAFKVNGKHASQELAVDIQNVFNRDNPFSIRYNAVAQEIVTIHQLGIFPVAQYRITF